jgi:peptidylprolyl isomerase
VRRSLVIALALCAAVTPACTRGADDAGADSSLSETDGAAASVVATTTAAPATTLDPSSTTTPMPVLDPATCEDVPDPAAHPLGELPTVLRPCTLPTELAVNVIHQGTGRAAANGDTLIVDYTGIRSADGELFDTSYLRGVPYDFVLGRGGVILGWDVGLLGSTAGSMVKLDVPADMAYGNTPPSDDIQPGDALTFLIEVRAVVASVTAADAPLELVVDPSVGTTGVNVIDAVVGEGTEVTAGSVAVVHALLVRGDNLTVLLNTWERSDPLQIVMAEGQSLPGIVTGLVGARIGTTRVISMPPDQAFGDAGEPGLGLPAGVDLIVVVEVIGVY